MNPFPDVSQGTSVRTYNPSNDNSSSSIKASFRYTSYIVHQMKFPSPVTCHRARIWSSSPHVRCLLLIYFLPKHQNKTQKKSFLWIRQWCKVCNKTRIWRSQPFIGDIPAGNIMSSSTINVCTLVLYSPKCPKLPYNQLLENLFSALKYLQSAVQSE